MIKTGQDALLSHELVGSLASNKGSFQPTFSS